MEKWVHLCLRDEETPNHLFFAEPVPLDHSREPAVRNLKPYSFDPSQPLQRS